MSKREITVYYGPDHEMHKLDLGESPLMVWLDYPVHGWGWVLLWGDGEDHFLGHAFVDSDAALEAARAWLDLVDQRDDE